MARINALGFDELLKDIDAELKSLPEVRDKMLIAGGERLQIGIKRIIRKMKIRDLGTTHDSIKYSEVKYAPGGHAIEVWPAGRRKDKKHPEGERNALVAFVTEYGTSKVKARPFMANAIRAYADDVAEAMMKVWKERGGIK